MVVLVCDDVLHRCGFIAKSSTAFPRANSHYAVVISKVPYMSNRTPEMPVDVTVVRTSSTPVVFIDVSKTLST
jgi:hypothetical protein